LPATGILRFVSGDAGFALSNDPGDIFFEVVTARRWTAPFGLMKK
jgi:hypothetical protein